MTPNENMNAKNQSGKTQLLKPEKLCLSPSNLRACLFNLIIYTDEPRRAAYYEDIVRLITKEFPCRIIFIKEDHSAGEPYIRMQMQTEKEELALNCDFINIAVSSPYLNRAPFMVLPLLVPDLPIYLLWGRDPHTENVILPHLQQYASKLVFDSETSADLQQFSQNTLKWMETSTLDITDLNWARIRGWREVLTHAFDSPQRIEQLRASKNIKIVFNDRPSDLYPRPQTQAIYLQAWLATQLKWEFQRKEQDHHAINLYYHNENGTVEIKLLGESKHDIPSEEILEFETADQSTFLYDLTRKKDNQIIVHCNTLDRCELPYTLQLPNILSGKSFMQEIFYKKTSDQYSRMLRMLALVPWKI